MKKPSKFFNYSVYVACSLTHASPEFIAEVELFKKELGTICNILRFLGLGGHAPYDIYKQDIQECVRKSDLVVAICDYPSIGLGYEMGTQIEGRRMPCLAIAHKKSLVSALIHDMRQPGVEFKRYDSLQKDGIKLVIEKLKEIHKSNKKTKVKTLV